MANDDNTSVTPWTGRIADPEHTGPQIRARTDESGPKKISFMMHLESPGLLGLVAQPHVVKLLKDAGVIEEFMFAHGFMQPKSPADALAPERAEEVCTIVNENPELGAIRDAVCEILYAESNYQHAYIGRVVCHTNIEAELALVACKNALEDVYERYMPWGSFEMADQIRAYNHEIWNCIKGPLGEQCR